MKVPIMSKPKDLDQKISNTVTSFRRTIGISQQLLAERLGVSRQTIYELEAGQSVPSIHLALKLALYFDVGVEELFSLNNKDVVKIMMRN